MHWFCVTWFTIAINTFSNAELSLNSISHEDVPVAIIPIKPLDTSSPQESSNNILIEGFEKFVPGNPSDSNIDEPVVQQSIFNGESKFNETALEESFPKSDGSGGRKKVYKTVRSPCSLLGNPRSDGTDNLNQLLEDSKPTNQNIPTNDLDPNSNEPIVDNSEIDLTRVARFNSPIENPVVRISRDSNSSSLLTPSDLQLVVVSPDKSSYQQKTVISGFPKSDNYVLDSKLSDVSRVTLSSNEPLVNNDKSDLTRVSGNNSNVILSPIEDPAIKISRNSNNEPLIVLSNMQPVSVSPDKSSYKGKPVITGDLKVSDPVTTDVLKDQHIDPKPSETFVQNSPPVSKNLNLTNTLNSNKILEQPIKVRSSSTTLLNVPHNIQVVPGVDTPIHPVANSKRAAPRQRPSVRRKSLKQVNPVKSNIQQAHHLTDKSVQNSTLNIVPNVESVPVNVNQQNNSQDQYNASTSAPTMKKQIPSSKPKMPETSSLVGNVNNSTAQLDPTNDKSHRLVQPPRSKKQSNGEDSAVAADKELVPCTCGVFLSGQFVKGSRAQPSSDPVVEHQQGQSFACTPAGKTQCQNKCLDMMVKHLPNSGTIICGSSDRDVYREKAYLWVKNCQDVWINTNLSSGKDHCCKDGQPIRCSQVS